MKNTPNGSHSSTKGPSGDEARRGVDSGLTRAQITETLTHLAFYAGWPRAMSAIQVPKAAFAD